MRHKTLTTFIYSLAAVAASYFWLIHQQQGTWSATPTIWLLFFAAPLLFVFAYPRFLFASSPAKTSRLRFAAIFHGFGAAIATILFVFLGSRFWKNPVRDVDSIPFLGIPLVAVCVFFVAAAFLLLKNKSTLAKFASFLFWPYWLLLALFFVERFFQTTPLRAAFCFLAFTIPIFFASAAGAISYRPRTAHASALAGALGIPWIYWTVLQDTPLGNVWTLFNVSDRELIMFGYTNLRLAELTIFSVGIIVLAIATAAIRLLPNSWNLRGLPVSERTWPAFVASFLFLIIWFAQSVMPYRISGAVDYGEWPILQILHVEKRGLQFHEAYVGISGRHDLDSVSFSENDRRLFQYRFQQRYASGKLPEPLKQRVLEILQSSKSASRDYVKPLREWNADGWYVNGEGTGLKAYVSNKGAAPPQEIVDLFNELQKIPHAQENQSDMKDVCLGFCYDPISGLGSLYANNRCNYDSLTHGYVCR